MTDGRERIGIGQRAPDFALPRAGGDPVRFYGVVGGRPTVLLFAGATGDEAVRRLATELADASDGLEVVRITRSAETASDDAFVDGEGAVHRGFGATDDDPFAVVLDRNLRVRATATIAEPDEAVTAIVGALPPVSDDDGLAPRTAPVLFVTDALSPAWRDRLLERWETEGAVATGVETVVDGERAEVTDVRRKRRRDHIVTDPTVLRELTQHIGGRVFPELDRAFAFAAGGFEGFKIGCYDADDAGYFEAHRDNLSTGTAHRRFGLTLNLNEDYEGGELRFPEYGAMRYRPDAGEALLFSGSHLHEVLPVTRGRRFVLVSFILARGGRPRT